MKMIIVKARQMSNIGVAGYSSVNRPPTVCPVNITVFVSLIDSKYDEKICRFEIIHSPLNKNRIGL